MNCKGMHVIRFKHAMLAMVQDPAIGAKMVFAIPGGAFMDVFGVKSVQRGPPRAHQQNRPSLQSLQRPQAKSLHLARTTRIVLIVRDRQCFATGVALTTNVMRLDQSMDVRPE